MSKPLQFGEPQPGLTYKDRPAAFGIAEDDGRIGCVRIERGNETWLDLPGGALDPGETAAQALVREFAEETGLVVRAGAEIVRADQRFLKSAEEPVNNRSVVFEAHIKGVNSAGKIEADHTLVWLEPLAAIRDLRHQSHAWAVARWVRERVAVLGRSSGPT